MKAKTSGSGQGIERVAAILAAVAKRNATGARLVDLANDTGLSKSTVHRIVNSLASQGLIDQADGSSFFLGFDLLRLGGIAANRYGMMDISRSHLDRLAERAGDTVIMTVPVGFESVVVGWAEGSFPIQINSSRLGERRPLGAGAGSVSLLAAMTEERVDEVLRVNAEAYTRYPGVDQAMIRNLISNARKDGYVYNDGGFIPGMCALACAVIATNGQPLAALSIATIRERMKQPRRTQLIEWLQEEAVALAERMEPLYHEKLRRAGLQR